MEVEGGGEGVAVADQCHVRLPPDDKVGASAVRETVLREQGAQGPRYHTGGRTDASKSAGSTVPHSAPRSG